MGILPLGRLLAIECKSEKGRLTEDQELWLKRMNEAGAVAFMARSIKDVEQVVLPLLADASTWIPSGQR